MKRPTKPKEPRGPQQYHVSWKRCGLNCGLNNLNLELDTLLDWILQDAATWGISTNDTITAEGVRALLSHYRLVADGEYNYYGDCSQYYTRLERKHVTGNPQYAEQLRLYQEKMARYPEELKTYEREMQLFREAKEQEKRAALSEQASAERQLYEKLKKKYEK